MSGNVYIEYSTNNGTDWSDVIESTTDNGSYSWTIPDEPSTNCLVRVSDTDGSPSDQSDDVFTISDVISPVHFLTVWSGNGIDHMNFYTLTATIDGIDMQPGDEIGIFDGNYCVGAGILTEVLDVSNFLAMVASKNDAEPPDVNGYTPENTVTYKLWDASEGVEIDTYYVEVTYSQGNNIFSIGGTSAFYINGTTAVEQIIPLTGGWNIFSLAVTPENIGMQQIIQPLVDEGTLEKVQDEAGNAIEYVVPFGWVNNIGDWSYTEGYKIRVNDNTDLIATGPAVPLPASIDLITGWNIMGYPALQPQNAQDALTNLIDDGYLLKVQDEAGNAIEYVVPFGWVDNIGDFEPGEGYKIKVSDNCILTFDEPMPLLKSTVNPTGKLIQPTHFKTSWEGNGLDHMNIYITAAQIDGLPLEPEDEVGIFDGDQCVGAVVVTGYEQYLSVPVSQDDPETSEKDGFTSQKRLTLRIWDASTGKEAGAVKATVLTGYSDAFEPMGTTIMKIQGSITGTGYISTPSTGLGRVYPNPFRDETTIQFSLSEDTHVLLEVYDATGDLVEVIESRNYPAGNHSVTWNTNNRIQGMYMLRMVAGDYNGVKTLITIE